MVNGINDVYKLKTSQKLQCEFANVQPTLSREIDNFTASRKEFSLLLKELADITKNPKIRAAVKSLP